MMKNINKATVAVAAVAVLFFSFLFAVALIVDDAHADTHESHTIQLSADLKDETIIVNQHDTVIINEYYREWYGGWFNSKYSEGWFLGILTGGRIKNLNNIADTDTITSESGLKTIYFSYGYWDHGVFNVENAHTFSIYTFTLDVREGKTITYKSNTNDFQYDWIDKARYDGTATIRNVSNAVTGHDFVGWNTNVGGSGTWYQPGDEVSSTTTLYAQWREKISVTSESEIILDKGGYIDYDLTYNQSDISAKIIDRGQLTGLNLSNNRLTGIVDNEPGKYTIKIQIEKGVQKSDFFLNVYVRIYEIAPIDELAFTGETWIRNIDFMPADVNYQLTYGSITRTFDGQTDNITPYSAGLANLSGTIVSGTFPHAGLYVINVTASAPDNPELRPTTVKIKVLVEDPVPSITAPGLDSVIVTESNIRDTYDFVAVNPSDYIQILWSFGDGTSSTGQSVVHRYDYPGMYQWTLTLKAHDGFDDAIYSGYVISLGPQDIPTDAWIDVEYVVMVSAPASAEFSGPDFLTATTVIDSNTGDTYLLITGIPDAEDWSDYTGITYDVRIADGGITIKEWSINLHGSSSSAPLSSFYVSVDGYTVTVKYLGSENSVVYVAWDGVNYVRLPGISGSYTYDEIGSYVRPVIVKLGGVQISDSVFFELRDPEIISVTMSSVYDVGIEVGEKLDMPLVLYPYGSSVTISGANWIKYSNGKLSGTPDVPGRYVVSVYATFDEFSSTTQSFIVNVTGKTTDSVSGDSSGDIGLSSVLILIVIGALAILTIVTRSARIGILTAILSMLFTLGVLL